MHRSWCYKASTQSLISKPVHVRHRVREGNMTTSVRVLAITLLTAATIALFSGNARAQVTTATLYGVVQDTSGAILPGVNVVVTHQGTNLMRETVSDERGEFALPALPAGPYAIKIEL